MPELNLIKSEECQEITCQPFLCILFVQLRTAAFKAYCAILVRRSNFRYQASPRVSSQQWKVELWAKNVR
jgi:hypothetical protein